MKNPLRGVIVEYKGGRRHRKMNAPSALWGDLDLKAIIREVKEETLQKDQTVSKVNASETIPVSVTKVSPVEPVPSAGTPEITVSDEAANPSQTVALSEAPPPKQVETQAPKQWEITPPAGRIRKARAKPTTIAAVSLQRTALTKDELRALEAENVALKRQLIKQLRHENIQLAKMLDRVNQTPADLGKASVL